MKYTLENISKLYGVTAALSEVNLTLGNGVYGLLGPNGAGKTTMMRIMTDLLSPSTGRVLLDGEDIHRLGASFRSRIGYLPQDFGYYPNFTAEQYLLYIARLKGIAPKEAKIEIYKLLEKVGLRDKMKQRLKSFSGGQRQRIGIAQALLGDPDILILDEPTAGLDPEERIRFRGIISALSRNKCVILSTHIVSDLEAVANEIVLLKRGCVIGKSHPSQLLEEISGKVWMVKVSPSEERGIMDGFLCSNVAYENGESHIRVISKAKPHESAVPISPNMEDVYLYYFGK